MRTHFLRGTTVENNSLTLASGELAIDLEKMALRMHDGTTLGGFEMIGSPIEFSAPGPQTLVAGDATTGFYGEISATDFIDGPTLASAIGLSAGSNLYPDAPWLKFSWQGNILFTPKLPLRYNLSWASIYQVGAVYGTNDDGVSPLATPVNQFTSVSIGSSAYRVRLLKLFDEDPVVNTVLGGDLTALLGGLVNTWGLYSESELTVAGTANGDASWVQETPNGSSTRYITTSGNLNTYTTKSTTYSTNYSSWRPVLELV